MKKSIRVLAITIAFIMISIITISAAPMIGIGSSAPEVSLIQQELLNRGYFNHEVTGYFGVITRDAVMRFQEDQGIIVDGVVGDETRAKLFPDGNYPYAEGASYSDEDLYWMARIVYSEAGSEPYQGKVAIGNVVLNRVRSGQFPNTVKGVIFQKNQFSPVNNGQIYNTPPQECIDAAIEALNGARPVGDSLFFCNPRISSSSWMIKSRPFYTSIANHNFYL